MKLRQHHFTLILLITSLCCYLEWAQQSAFLFQVEYALFFKAAGSIEGMVHPLIIIPFIGQLVLLWLLIKPATHYKWHLLAILLLGLLIGLIFLVGILALNWRIILSTLPFIIASIFTIRQHRSLKKQRTLP